MRQQKNAKKPLSEEFEYEYAQKIKVGGANLNKIIQNIRLEDVSLEERRRQARQPLYLVRYE